MNPITDIVFFLTWVFLFIWAIRTMSRGWNIMSKSSPPPTGMWTTQVKKPIHPEMIDVEPGTELMGVNFDDKKDDPLLQSLQDRIEELDNNDEEDDDDDGDVIVRI
jgi:allophanate hydrolase subunit 1